MVMKLKLGVNDFWVAANFTLAYLAYCFEKCAAHRQSCRKA